MRLSNRDIILLVGVVVAVVLTVTAFVYRNELASARHEVLSPARTSLVSKAHKLFEIIDKHSSVKHSR